MNIKLNMKDRVLKKFLSRWRIFGSRWRLHVPEHHRCEGGGVPPLGWWGDPGVLPWKILKF